VNTFAGVKKANSSRAICVDSDLETYVELHAYVTDSISDRDEAYDLAPLLHDIDNHINGLSQEWESIQAFRSRVQIVEINAEVHAALLSRFEPASQLVSTHVLEVPRALVAQHSPPNLSRHLSSNAPPASLKALSEAALVST
jgi:hypothetical protein